MLDLPVLQIAILLLKIKLYLKGLGLSPGGRSPSMVCKMHLQIGNCNRMEACNNKQLQYQAASRQICSGLSGRARGLVPELPAVPRALVTWVPSSLSPHTAAAVEMTASRWQADKHDKVKVLMAMVIPAAESILVSRAAGVAGSLAQSHATWQHVSCPFKNTSWCLGGERATAAHRGPSWVS